LPLLAVLVVLAPAALVLAPAALVLGVLLLLLVLPPQPASSAEAINSVASAIAQEGNNRVGCGLIMARIIPTEADGGTGTSGEEGRRRCSSVR
jgi:hypothetical protein